MTALPIVLLLIGAGLFCAEMFIPGFGVCGVTGIILVVISAVITIATVPAGLFIVLAEISVLAAVVAVIFNYIKRTQLHGKIVLDETLAEDAKAIGDPEYFLGKEGVAKTTLRPFGEAEFNGVTVEVVSDGKYIPINTRIKVTAVEGQRIIVQANENAN